MRWGQDALYLHTFSNNTGAIALYERRGYHLHGERRRLSALWTGRTERLYRKHLMPPSRMQLQIEGKESVEGALRKADNVFVWERVSERERG